ncbi:MAG: hypothetical protein L6R39_007790 [Caloplaca ligustica]|nr:MAG: hypothetical protein L6R39_007790 [Caloplaca ligustica]
MAVSVRQTRTTDSRIQPSISRFGDERDEELIRLCASVSSSLQLKLDGIESSVHQEGNVSGAIPTISIQGDRKPTSTSGARTSKQDPEDSHALVITGRTNRSTKQTTKAKVEAFSSTSSSDERGRTAFVAQGPVFKDLRVKLNLDLSRNVCHGTTQKGKGCTLRIAKKDYERAQIIVERLETGNLDGTPGTSSEHLKDLAQLLHCKRYHQKDAPVLVQTWEATIGIHTEPIPKSSPVVTSTTISVSATPAKLAAQAFDFIGVQTCIRTLIAFDPRAKSESCTAKFVRGALEKSSTPRDIEKKGVIYIYWFPGNFGHIKIGATTAAPEKRLKEWQRKCGHEPQLWYPATEEDRRPIPHVFRVEKIIQAQLRHCRRKETRCRKCHGCHREWFESSVGEAVAVVRKWSAWIQEDPYEVSGGVWKLKESQREKFNDLCKISSSPPEDRPRSISTSRWKERNEENSRRLSAPSLPNCRTRSTESPRRSGRLPAKQRRKSAVGGDDPNGSHELTFNLQPDSKPAEPIRRSIRISEQQQQKTKQ